MAAHRKVDPERCLFELKYVVLEVCGGKAESLGHVVKSRFIADLSLNLLMVSIC